MKPSRAAARQAVAAEKTATTMAELHTKVETLAELAAGPDHQAQLDRIEAKLDQLLAALGSEPAAAPTPASEPTPAPTPANKAT